MRALGPRKRGSARRRLAFAAFAALVLFSGAALADCAVNPFVSIQASAGATCLASGNYVSTDVIAGQATGAGSVLTNDIDVPSSVSFSTSAANTPAVQADTGGSVTLTVMPSSTTGTVTTSGNNSAGLYATGSASSESGPVASSISVQNINISTTGSMASGAQADTGGQISLTGGSVTVSGTQSFDLLTNDSGTQIQATNLTSTSSVPNWTAVQADTGSSLSYTDGSITTTSAATSATNVLAIHGSSITLSGVTIEADGNGTGALSVGDCCSSTPDSGASITGSGLTIISKGTTDPATTFNANFATNPNGGTLSLSNSTLTSTGADNFGIYTAKTSVTTLTNDTILQSGPNSIAVSSQGGQTTINGGSITSTGAGSFGVNANGGSVTMTGGSVTMGMSGVMGGATGVLRPVDVGR
jgi:fibronectin-binding autotransporter adhesin